jgi:hypothetical protein
MYSGRPGIVGKLVAYGRYAVSRQYRVRFGRFKLYCPPPAAIIPIVALGIWCTGTLHHFSHSTCLRVVRADLRREAILLA